MRGLQFRQQLCSSTGRGRRHRATEGSDFRSDHGSHLQQRFAFRAEAVDTRSDHRLHRFGDLDFADFPGQFITAAAQRSTPLSTSVLTVSSMNSGVPPVRSTIRARNSAVAALSPSKDRTSWSAALVSSGSRSTLVTHSLLPSWPVVLRPARQDHQQAAGAHGFHQAFDHVLRLDIGPLHVLEPEQKRTILDAAQEQVLDGRPHSLPPNCRLQRRPIGIVDSKLEQRLQCRNIGRRACR